MFRDFKRKALGQFACTGVEEAAAVGAAGAGTAAAGTAATGLAAWAPYLAAAASVAGTLIQSQAQQEAQEQQQAKLRQAQDADRQKQEKATDISMQQGEQYDPTYRAQQEAATVGKANDSLTSTLVDAREGAAAPAASAGKVSNDFTLGQAKSAAGELQRSTNVAKLMASMRGNTDLRANEGINNADFMEQQSALAGDRSGAANAANLDASMIHPDGTQMLLGGLTSAAGNAYLGSSLASKAKATPKTSAPATLLSSYASDNGGL